MMRRHAERSRDLLKIGSSSTPRLEVTRRLRGMVAGPARARQRRAVRLTTIYRDLP